ncbi:hypothetical protein [Candidatus Thiodictyon syntrophicum]|jgi:hypothetical protein|uniref:ATP-binding protein n=1 Tax=Candidatus Thiodictyon syntrophicum TaxID=1166950 RepID=A0A2K8U3P0_9GAMM|nr:hypothetical protein [Candidatus Thiodictyon syntrophicum]AUB79661.1 hypothetical protein THSYN_00925 [Candidatus Thiodictyon syntrophicum]
MSLADKIMVNAHYTRSVNLERDFGSAAVVRGYIPTPRAIQTLARIVDTLIPEAAPRAWSLVGPYGAGKSSFAAFLTHLLAPQGDQVEAAIDVLERAEPALAERYRMIESVAAPDRRGHCVVVLTGTPEPFGRRLAQALSECAANHWANRIGRRPDVIEVFRRLANLDRVPASELLAAVAALQDALARGGSQGLLIVIDELGKFLEYEARHYGADDIYLLQALAERANAAHPAKLTLIVLLHQAMDQYARGLGDTLRNEWAKVQGRFESIPFVESAEQVLRVVAAAFTHRFTDDERTRIIRYCAEIADQLAATSALPKTLDATTAADIFARCYPLHPLSAMLLPTLCQKVAQNERTLFSYLGSHEPHGLGDSLARLSGVDDWVMPWEVYEYFILNQSAAVADHYTRRRWMEVVTAVERLGDAPERDIRLLKSIGLLNIVGAQGGFKASREVVALCADPPGTAVNTVRSLAAKSVLQFRKFSGEYRVWEGSDFDLDAAVAEQIERIGRFNLAGALNKRKVLEPIVARRHTIKTGTLRYFMPIFADPDSFRRLPERASGPRVIFFLVRSQVDRQRLADEVLGYFCESDIVVECPDADRLRQVIAEVMALDLIQREAQALNTDPVAQREFKDRYALATTRERDMLRALADDPKAGTWYWRGEPLSVKTRRGLQSALTDVLDRVYHASPVIRNELINRDKPSSQAAAARNKLLAAMLHHQAEADLGIDKYPPERAIYLALLRAPGIHRQVEGRWQFDRPATAGAYNLGPVWDRIDQFLADTQKKPQPFTALDEVLQASPFGIKRGVLPILYIAAYLVNQDEAALFEEGRYVPYLTDDQLERFVRRPGDFAVQSFRIEGLRASLFKEYSRILFGDPDCDRTILALARPLAKFMGDLPEFSASTKRVSITAQRVRSAFMLAKSPQILLFEQLPEACGLPSIQDTQPDERQLKTFSDRLRDALRELKSAYPDLIAQFQRLLAQAFNLERICTLADLRAVLRGRVEGLDRYTIDADGLRAFIRRISKYEGDDEDWLSNLLLFLGHKPSKKWTDTEADAAEFRLADLARRMHDLERLRVHYDGQRQTRDKDFDVVLLRAVRKGASERDEVVCIDSATRAAIKTTKAAIEARLAELLGRDLQIAVLAEIVDQVLDRERSVVPHQEDADYDKPLTLAIGDDNG